MVVGPGCLLGGGDRIGRRKWVEVGGTGVGRWAVDPRRGPQIGGDWLEPPPPGPISVASLNRLPVSPYEAGQTHQQISAGVG